MEAKLTGHQSGGLYTEMQTDPSILTAAQISLLIHLKLLRTGRLTSSVIRLCQKTLSRVLLQAGGVHTTAVFVTMSRSKTSSRMSMVNTCATKILRPCFKRYQIYVSKT